MAQMAMKNARILTAAKLFAAGTAALLVMGATAGVAAADPTSPSTAPSTSVHVMLTATTISGTSAKVSYGKSSTIVAHVVGGSALIGGTASAIYRKQVVATAAVINGKSVLTLPVGWNTATRRVTIRYNGDATHSTSVAAVDVLRSHAVAGFTAKYSNLFAVTVTLAPVGAGRVPNGHVVVYIGSAAVQTIVLVAGHATFGLPIFEPSPNGARLPQISVQYSGDGNYRSATLHL